MTVTSHTNPSTKSQKEQPLRKYLPTNTPYCYTKLTMTIQSAPNGWTCSPINPSTIDTGNRVVFSQGTIETGGTANRFYVAVRTISGTNVLVILKDGQVTESFCGQIPLNQWTHFSLVVGTAATKCYVNGKLIDTFSKTYVGFAICTSNIISSGGNPI